jgi:hypothetical protein
LKNYSCFYKEWVSCVFLMNNKLALCVKYVKNSHLNTRKNHLLITIIIILIIPLENNFQMPYKISSFLIIKIISSKKIVCPNPKHKLQIKTNQLLNKFQVSKNNLFLPQKEMKIKIQLFNIKIIWIPLLN